MRGPAARPSSRSSLPGLPTRQALLTSGDPASIGLLGSGTPPKAPTSSAG